MDGAETELRNLALRMAHLSQDDVQIILLTSSIPANTPDRWKDYPLEWRLEEMFGLLASLPHAKVREVGDVVLQLEMSEADQRARDHNEKARDRTASSDASDDERSDAKERGRQMSHRAAIARELAKKQEAEAAFRPQAKAPASKAPASGGPIFVVHGRDRSYHHEVVRGLKEGTDREVLVLKEMPNKGRTLLEKFEDYARDAAYVVVLLTADDEGGLRDSGDMRPRARQNVVFELGFFFGKLGRDKVSVLVESGAEKPTDIDGLVHISLNQSGSWKTELAKELRGAGIPTDASRMP